MTVALAIALALDVPLQDAVPAAPAVPETIEERRMRLPIVGEATVYVPADPTDRAILFVSGDGGWSKGVVDMARRAAGDVPGGGAGLSYPTPRKAGLPSKGACWYPAGGPQGVGPRPGKQAAIPRITPP